MKRIQASSFKAGCLEIMKTVHATGEPVVVTKRGVPLVRVIPFEKPSDDVFGFMSGEFEIAGDVESPVVSLDDWNVTRK